MIGSFLPIVGFAVFPVVLAVFGAVFAVLVTLFPVVEISVITLRLQLPFSINNKFRKFCKYKSVSIRLVKVR